MAEFLTRRDVSARLEKIIRNAEKELILISPYVKIDRHTRGDLDDLLARRGRIKIHLIYRNKNKTDLDPEDMDWLESKSSIRLSFQEDLHAKCYLNESQALLTSMNLHDYSQKNNIEMGILASCGEDLYDEIRKEAEYIRRISKVQWEGGVQEAKEPYDPGPPEPPEKGFCIRCKNDLPANPKVPYCRPHYHPRRKWDKKENYCHTCGKGYKASRRDPLCPACDEKIQGHLRVRS